MDAAKSPDDAIRLTALRWLRSFVADAQRELLPLYASILQAILPALSSSTPEILQVRAPPFLAAARVDCVAPAAGNCVPCGAYAWVARNAGASAQACPFQFQ